MLGAPGTRVSGKGKDHEHKQQFLTEKSRWWIKSHHSAGLVAGSQQFACDLVSVAEHRVGDALLKQERMQMVKTRAFLIHLHIHRVLVQQQLL